MERMCHYVVRVRRVNHGCWILIESEDSVRTILNEGVSYSYEILNNLETQSLGTEMSSLSLKFL